MTPIDNVISIEDINNHCECPENISENRCNLCYCISEILRDEDEENSVEIRKAEILSEKNKTNKEQAMK